MRIKGSAIYKDMYQKVDGKWLIQKTGYTRVFEERWFVTDHQIPTNMHASK